MGKKIEIPKDELKELYLNQKLTTYQIARISQCCQATIWKRLHKFRIKPRNNHELYSNIPSKEELIRYYTKEGLSNWRIQEKYGYNRSTVYNKLKEYNLIKSKAYSHIKYKRKEFDGNLIKKAYMIGFRIGDLRVRKVGKESETIHVDCGSTKEEQINLIKDLFEGYGRIWIKKNKNNKTQIEAFLDLSFSFLLSKEFPEWIMKKNKYFFSFLAGFSDAEGCIKINRDMAYYSLGNYDYEILNIIRDKLIKNKINCQKIIISKTKGKLATNGYINNGDYCMLRIQRKESLFRLLNMIKPYIKHEQKIKDLKIAKDNIISRNEKYRYINWRR